MAVEEVTLTRAEMDALRRGDDGGSAAPEWSRVEQDPPGGIEFHVGAPDSEDMTATHTPAETIYDELAELGFCPADEAFDAPEVFPAWVSTLRNTDAAAVTPSGRIVTVFDDSGDETFYLHIFDRFGVLMTRPITFGTDETGTALFLAALAVAVTL